MKITSVAFLALFCIIASTTVYACGGNGCSGDNDSCSSCSSYSGPSPCECADPQCYSGNPCLNQSDCCAVFGNIGSANQNSYNDDE